MPAPATLRDSSAPEPASAASFTWSDARLLGYGPMDETHQEFYQVAFRLLTCDDTTMEAALLDFQRHAVDALRAGGCLDAQHGLPAARLPHRGACGGAEVGRRGAGAVRAGSADAALVQDLALHLFQWFPGHADYLDSALAAWMSKRAHGGKPIVLRRGAARR